MGGEVFIGSLHSSLTVSCISGSNTRTSSKAFLARISNVVAETEHRDSTVMLYAGEFAM